MLPSLDFVISAVSVEPGNNCRSTYRAGLAPASRPPKPMADDSDTKSLQSLPEGSDLSSETGPGFFYVLSKPRKGHEEAFHDWYDNEHGPARKTLDFIKTGERYRSLKQTEVGAVAPDQDAGDAVYLASYDVTRLTGFEEPQYKKLRANRSVREQDVLDNKIEWLDRRFYKNLNERTRNGEEKGRYISSAPLIMSVRFVVRDEDVEEMNRWYEEVSSAGLGLNSLTDWCRNIPRTSRIFPAGSVVEGWSLSAPKT